MIERLSDPADRATILDIAFSAGFRSQQTFYRLFKTETGLSPALFRKNSVPVTGIGILIIILPDRGIPINSLFFMVKKSSQIVIWEGIVQMENGYLDKFIIITIQDDENKEPTSDCHCSSITVRLQV